MEKILELKHVTYDYHTKAGDVHAVKGVSATFETGTLYAIVGKSGSGKSTLLSVCAGLDLPASGEVLYKGQSLAEMDRDKYRREEAGMIFQSFYLLPQLTARENVELSLDLCNYKGNRKHRALELLQKVGLTEFHSKKRPSQLSGGEQQRVAIARTLAPSPNLILADEPTGSLDAENGKNVIEILKGLAHEEGKCVIVITHAADIAAEADHVYRMNDGYMDPVESCG